MVPFRKRTLRPPLVALGVSLAVAAVPTVASASIGLGTVGPGAVSRPGIGGETRRRIALRPVP